MHLGKSSNCYRASIDPLLLFLLGAVLGLPAHGYGQEVISGDELELEYVSPQTSAKEPSRKERLDQLRRCQVCPRDGVGFRFGIPIFVPLAAFRASGDGDEEGTPQLVDFDTRLRFGIEGQLLFRFGNVTLEAQALAVSLGTHAVLSLEDQSQDLGDLGLWFVTGAAVVKWNIPPLQVGEVKRPTRVALWPYVGGRLTVVSGRAKGASERLMLTRTVFWGEPLIGLETIFDPPSGWSFDLNANVGGFTVGADVSARVHALANYHFTAWFAIRMGYAVIYVRGRPDNRLIDELEVFLHGPMISFQFSTP